MKALLRLRPGLCPDREISVGSYQLSAISHQPSEWSCQRSLISHQAKLWLIPKTYYILSTKQLSDLCNQPSVLDSWLPAKSLIPKKKLSAVGNQRSDMSCLVRAVVGKLIPNAYHLIPFLILVFVSCGAALAQEPVVHTAPAAKAETKTIDPIYVGGMLPDDFWDREHTFYHKGDTITGNLQSSKGNLLILDFWATWCGSCIVNFSKLEELQTRFKDDLSVLLVNSAQTKDTFERIDLLMTGKKTPYRTFDLASIINDEMLFKYFPNRVIPHYVWIINNQVRAITTSEMLSEDNIKHMLERSNKLYMSKNMDLRKGEVR